MKTLFSRIIDWLQATFPPNRIAILLGGIITAVAGTIAAWLAAHFPGLNLGAPEIAGVLGAALLITIRLLDKWLDQWQAGEPIAVHPDIEAAIEELADSPDVVDLYNALGSLEGIGIALGDLRTRLDSPGDQLLDEDISKELVPIIDTIGAVLEQHAAQRDPAINAAAAQSQE